MPRRSLHVGLYGAVVLLVSALVAFPRSANAQNEADVAIRFFTGGGAYCFRVTPEGMSLSDETEWTIMVLTGTSNRKTSFRVRTVDPGETRLSGQTLADVGLAITNVWRRESVREEFFRRFAAGIEGKVLRARTVKMAPSRLAEMKPGQRAELYLQFADRGSKVDFGKTSDMKASDFLTFQPYLTD